MSRHLILLVIGSSMTTPAAAYIGPGLGLGSLGALIGVVISVLLAIFALLWYPLKRLLARLRSRKEP